MVIEQLLKWLSVNLNSLMSTLQLWKIAKVNCQTNIYLEVKIELAYDNGTVIKMSFGLFKVFKYSGSCLMWSFWRREKLIAST